LLNLHPKKVGRGMKAEMLIEQEEMERRTPVDKGDLIAAYETSDPVYRGDDITVAISNTDPKAVFVHEDLEAFHSRGQAKFMESVMNESESHMAGRVAKRVNIEDLI